MIDLADLRRGVAAASDAALEELRVLPADSYEFERVACACAYRCVFRAREIIDLVMERAMHRNETRTAVFTYACWRGDDDVLEKVLGIGFKPDVGVLAAACARGCLTTFRRVFPSRPDTFPTGASSGKWSSTLVLAGACQGNNADIVSTLVEWGYTKAAFNAGGNASGPPTVFCDALRQQRYDGIDTVARALGVTVADMRADAHSATTLAWMASRGHQAGIEWLINRMVIAGDAPSQPIYAALAAACEYRQFGVAETLIAIGAVPTAKTLGTLATYIDEGGADYAPALAIVGDVLRQFGDAVAMRAAERAVLSEPTPWRTTVAWMTARVRATDKPSCQPYLRALQYAD